MLKSMSQLLAEREALERRVDETVADADPATMSPEAMAALQKLMADLDALKVLMEARSRLDARERRSPVTPIGGGADPRFTAFTRTISISDAIAASLGSESRGAGAAREASAEIARQRGKTPQGIYISMGAAAAAERRDVLTQGLQGNPPTGAALIPTIVRSDLLIDALRAALVLEALGVTFLTGLTGNVSVPRTSQGTSVGWFAENAPIPETSIAFDAVPLSIKHVGAIIPYSRNMLLNSSADIDALIRSDLMRALAVEIEHAALAGSGDGVVPRGILNTPGVQSLPMGDTLTWAGVLALPAKVAGANVPMNKPGFIGSPLFRAKAMDTLSAPDVASQFIMTEPDRLASYLFASTNQIPPTPATTGTGGHPARSTLIFGAWENLIVGVWDALDLTTNPWAEDAYRKGNVLVRIIADLDVAVRHPEAFVYADDVAA